MVESNIPEKQNKDTHKNEHNDNAQDNMNTQLVKPVTLQNKKTIKECVAGLISALKRFMAILKKKVPYCSFTWNQVLSCLLTVLIVPQVLTVLNERASQREELEDSIQQIYINYEAGNYPEMEQEIFRIYPKLQEKKEYETLIAFTDMLLGSMYQDFFENRSELPASKKELINYYVDNALEYAEKADDIENYINICKHVALFNISQYEFTLKTNYLDYADDALDKAGSFFDENHAPEIAINDISDANLACQFFNLKNLQYQVCFYRAVIGYPYGDMSFNHHEESEDAKVEKLSELFDNLYWSTTQFVSCAHIIEDQNTNQNLIPNYLIQHMKIRAAIAYVETGNLIHDFATMLPIILHGGRTEGAIYMYDDLALCIDLLDELEKQAIEIENYEDLYLIYKAAETYFYLDYISTGSNESLIKYNEYIDKLIALDPSGDLLSPYIIETGNELILGRYIEKAENRLSEMTFAEDPFSFSLLKYKLGTHYLDRALYYDEIGERENAKSDYESAKKCYNSALIYFTKEKEGISDVIDRQLALVIEKLANLK